MTKREQDRISRLLADLGHTSVVDALRHAKRMRSALRAVQTWGAHHMRPDDMWYVAIDALDKNP